MEKQVVSGLNQYLADTGVLYIKLHNLHWNVVGKQFKPTHEYLETLYDGFAEILDEVAEVLKMHNETPLASLKDYLSVTTVKEIPSVELSVEKVLEILEADIELMKNTAEDIRTKADEAGLYDVVAVLEAHLGNYVKTLWFLNAMGK
ncbi:MAG: Dps family protein [Anaerorhabdus sp.]